MAKFDHHLHTARHSPDSIIDPDELIEVARAVGLDGVVITEHDYQWTAAELEEMNRRSGGLVILSGAEISTRQGHFLVYGLPNLRHAWPGIDLGDLLKVVRQHDAAIVAAHPFRWDQEFGALVAKHGPAFDALELVSNNVTPETRSMAEDLLAKHPMGRTGSSDGHEPEIVGCYYSEFPGTIATMPEFVQALKSRQGQPRHSAGRPQASGPMES